jgi:hypothetical protein
VTPAGKAGAHDGAAPCCGAAPSAVPDNRILRLVTPLTYHGRRAVSGLTTCEARAFLQAFLQLVAVDDDLLGGGG